jgi:hypothetical protein
MLKLVVRSHISLYHRLLLLYSCLSFKVSGCTQVGVNLRLDLSIPLFVLFKPQFHDLLFRSKVLFSFFKELVYFNEDILCKYIRLLLLYNSNFVLELPGSPIEISLNPEDLLVLVNTVLPTHALDTGLVIIVNIFHHIVMH